jgi:hypothetical protein
MLSKVVIEIRFKKKIPRSALEAVVTDLCDAKSRLIEPYKKYDADVQAKVWFEDLSKQSVTSNPFLKVLKIKR